MDAHDSAGPGRCGASQMHFAKFIKVSDKLGIGGKGSGASMDASDSGGFVLCLASLETSGANKSSQGKVYKALGHWIREWEDLKKKKKKNAA